MKKRREKSEIIIENDMSFSLKKSGSKSASSRQSLSFVIIVTTYFLLFFSAGIYFSSLKGQITQLIVITDITRQEWSAGLLAEQGGRMFKEAMKEKSLEGLSSFSPEEIARIGREINNLKRSDDEWVVLFDRSGKLAFTPDEMPAFLPGMLKDIMSGAEIESGEKGNSSESEKASTVSLNPPYNKIFVTSVPLEAGGYNLGLVSNRSKLLAGASKLELSLLGTLLLTFSLVLVLFFLMLRMIMSPLKVLVNAVHRIGQGELDTRVKVKSETEIGVLADEFNRMAEEIGLKYGEIKEYSERMEILNVDAQRTLLILAKRNRELGLINAVSLESGRHFSINDNLKYLVDELADSLELQFADAFIRDERRKEWSLIISSRNSAVEAIPEGKFISLLDRAASSGKTIMVSGKNYPLSLSSGMEPSEICLFPVDVGSDTQVLILLATDEKAVFSGREIEFIVNILKQESVILHNAQLYEISLRRSDILEKINTIGQTIIGELNLEKLFPRILRELKSLLGVDRINLIYIGLVEGIAKCYSLDEEWELSDFEELQEDKWCNRTIGEFDMVLEQGRNDTPDWVWDLYGENYGSFLGIPLGERKNPGLLAFYSIEPRFFTHDDIQFIKTFANYLTSSLANARLFSEISEREQIRTQQLEVAKKFQTDRIPYQFEQGQLEFECSLEPAMELAGDFFDVFSLGSRTVGFVIGDVATKGIAASLMTFSILSLFRNAAKTMRPPNKVMTLVNQGLVSQIKEQSWFATAFYARVHTDDLVMTYAKAGHVLPILYRHATRECIPIDIDGMPLGIFENGDFQTGQVKLEEMDRLILYTDGVTETRMKDNRLFGIDGLMKVISEHGHRPIIQLKEAIFEELGKVNNNRCKKDDIIVAVLGIKMDPWVSRKMKFDDLEELVEDVMGQLKKYDISKSINYAIRLSLSETIANAYKHGNRGDSTRDINVSYLITDDTFKLKVSDEGSGFDYEALPDPTVEENLMRPNGRGIFLVRSFMDEVEFNNSGNTIQVLKYLQDNKPIQKRDSEESMEGIPEIALLDKS